MTDQRLRSPDFLNVGAQKAASTWLYNCLREHPRIFMGPKNRIRFFQHPDYAESRWNWYLSHFRGAASSQIVGDSRVEYLYRPESPGLISRHLPRCKIIVLLRDPLDRAFSAYLWLQRRRLLPFDSPDAGLEEALTYVGRRPTDERSLRLVRILEMGVYHEQLERYFDAFDYSRVLILLTETVRREPLRTLQAAFRFLGVEDGFRPAALETRPTRALGSPLMIRAERATVGIPGSFRLLQAVSRLLATLGVGAARPELGDCARRRLEEYYRPHNRRLLALLTKAQGESGGTVAPLGLAGASWLSAAAE